MLRVRFKTTLAKPSATCAGPVASRVTTAPPPVPAVTLGGSPLRPNRLSVRNADRDMLVLVGQTRQFHVTQVTFRTALKRRNVLPVESDSSSSRQQRQNVTRVLLVLFRETPALQRVLIVAVDNTPTFPTLRLVSTGLLFVVVMSCGWAFCSVSGLCVVCVSDDGGGVGAGVLSSYNYQMHAVARTKIMTV